MFDDPNLNSVPPYSFFCPISIYFAYCSEINYRVLISNYHSPSRLEWVLYQNRKPCCHIQYSWSTLMPNACPSWTLSYCSPCFMSVKLRSGYPILVKSKEWQRASRVEWGTFLLPSVWTFYCLIRKEKDITKGLGWQNISTRMFSSKQVIHSGCNTDDTGNSIPSKRWDHFYPIRWADVKLNQVM